MPGAVRQLAAEAGASSIGRPFPCFVGNFQVPIDQGRASLLKARLHDRLRGEAGWADVTLLLDEARQGNGLAIDRLFELLFPELKRIAHARLRFRDDRMLMDTGSLVNETYLRLLGVERLTANDRGHFLTYAARVMRSVMVDLVREQRSQRRGGEHQVVTLDTAAINLASGSGADEVLRVHEALEELALIDERLVRVVEMRYFVGFDTAEIASSLGVTTRTVERDWEKARSFLYQSLKGS